MLTATVAMAVINKQLLFDSNFQLSVLPSANSQIVNLYKPGKRKYI